MIAAACSDGSATRYAGSVMDETAPQSLGSLRLTFFSRTDSSFAGVMELGAPAHGTGTAYAWFEDGDLRIVTVGSRSGDTIRWTSTLTDTTLGGRYLVTGGRHAGQQGTWRARLVSGPPATPATLRSPPPAPVPTVSSLWPLLLLLMAAVALGRWIRRAPGAAAGEAYSPSGRRRVGGWLVVFFVGQLLTVVTWFTGVDRSWTDYTRTLGSAAVFVGLRPLIVLETAMFMLSLPIVLVGLFLLARRSRCTPRYWFSYHMGIALYVLADHAAMAFIHPQMARLYGDHALARSTASGTMTGRLGTVVAALIWSLYWVRSRRVRATFGAAALDREVTLPPATPSEAGVDLASVVAGPGRGTGTRPAVDGRTRSTSPTAARS